MAKPGKNQVLNKLLNGRSELIHLESIPMMINLDSLFELTRSDSKLDTLEQHRSYFDVEVCRISIRCTHGKVWSRSLILRIESLSDAIHLYYLLVTFMCQWCDSDKNHSTSDSKFASLDTGIFHLLTFISKSRKKFDSDKK